MPEAVPHTSAGAPLDSNGDHTQHTTAPQNTMDKKGTAKAAVGGSCIESCRSNWAAQKCRTHTFTRNRTRWRVAGIASVLVPRKGQAP